MSEPTRSEYAKTTPEHERDLTDESADPWARHSAIGAVTFDRRYEFEPVLREYVDHPNPIVRAAATRRLLAMWEREDLVDRAIEMALSDPDEYVRGEVVTGLGYVGTYGGVKPGTIDRVARALIRVMMTEEDWVEQVSAYNSLYSLLMGRRAPMRPDEPFDRDRDVDWEMLGPYLD